MSGKVPDLGSFADERDEARFSENASILRELRTARSVARQNEERIADLEQRLSIYEILESARLEPPKWLTPKHRRKKRHAIPCLAFGDLHFDEVVDPAQVGGVNCYNRDIATQRIRRAFEGAVRVARDYFAGLTFDGIQVFLTGDMLSGTIHEELRETNDATAMEGVLAVLEPIEAGLNLLQEFFGKVNVAAVVGNHGRNTRKPRAKNRAQDNLDWLIYKVLERDLAGRENLSLQVSDAADQYVRVFDTTYLLTHGDQFRGGSGISGALSPLLIGAARKTRRAAAMERPFDCMVMGHWHQLIFYPSRGLIVSGAGKGYDEYAYQKNLPFEPPQHAYWITTPENGITFSAPIFVQDREQEGW